MCPNSIHFGLTEVLSSYVGILGGGPKYVLFGDVHGPYGTLHMHAHSTVCPSALLAARAVGLGFEG